MNVIILEDEKLSAEYLANMLHRLDKEILVTHTFDTVKASVAEFRQGLSADLLFVDIHLADGISFDLFTQVTIDIPIIFTTAYDEYALHAFKLNSVDYLLKPIAIEELRQALAKFSKYKQQFQPTWLATISQAYNQLAKPTKSRFLVKSGQTIDSIKTEDVLHFQTQDSITFLVIESGKRFPIDYTLEQVESLVEPAHFFRINRKILINIKAIEKVSTYPNSRLMIQSKFLEGEMSIVSRERVNDFKQWLDS
jgi:DNA-binding LytR/AlgR family response regulator